MTGLINQVGVGVGVAEMIVVRTVVVCRGLAWLTFVAVGEPIGVGS